MYIKRPVHSETFRSLFHFVAILMRCQLGYMHRLFNDVFMDFCLEMREPKLEKLKVYCVVIACTCRRF